MGGACSTGVEMTNVYSILAGKPEGKRQLGRHRRRWGVSNIRMNVRETGREGVDWMHLAQDKDQ